MTNINLIFLVFLEQRKNSKILVNSCIGIFESFIFMKQSFCFFWIILYCLIFPYSLTYSLLFAITHISDNQINKLSRQGFYFFVKLRVLFFTCIQTMKTNDGYQFSCQHGPIECQANIVHACSIDVIKDSSIRLQFVICMIENNIDPVGIMNKCAERISVDLEAIKECSNNERGKELLANYGKMTNSLAPRVSFIPTITLDRVSIRFIMLKKK